MESEIKVMLKEKVLVLAVHPDDETLGCGGTLLKHKSDGDSIHWLIATKISQEKGFSNSEVESRAKEIEMVKNKYQFDSVHFLDLDTMYCEQYPLSEIIKKCSHVINEVKPSVIYVPFRGDVHSDHRVCFDAIYACTKSFRYPFIKKVLMMETLSETEFSITTADNMFIPNVFININEHIHKKCEIMEIYKSECGDHPFPRSTESIQSLAKFRGGTAGVNFAESFMLLKEIRK